MIYYPFYVNFSIRFFFSSFDYVEKKKAVEWFWHYFHLELVHSWKWGMKKRNCGNHRNLSNCLNGTGANNLWAVTMDMVQGQQLEEFQWNFGDQQRLLVEMFNRLVKLQHVIFRQVLYFCGWIFYPAAFFGFYYLITSDRNRSAAVFYCFFLCGCSWWLEEYAVGTQSLPANEVSLEIYRQLYSIRRAIWLLCIAVVALFHCHYSGNRNSDRCRRSSSEESDDTADEDVRSFYNLRGRWMHILF